MEIYATWVSDVVSFFYETYFTGEVCPKSDNTHQEGSL